jgi:hypothetical protein
VNAPISASNSLSIMTSYCANSNQKVNLFSQRLLCLKRVQINCSLCVPWPSSVTNKPDTCNIGSFNVFMPHICMQTTKKSLAAVSMVGVLF